MNLSIALHELTEQALCGKAEIPNAIIDEFDMTFTGPGEPGDAPDCPYRLQHQQAHLMEFLFSKWLGLNWNDYEATCDTLTQSRNTTL
jgi:hypothetical protein